MASGGRAQNEIFDRRPSIPARVIVRNGFAGTYDQLDEYLKNRSI